MAADALPPFKVAIPARFASSRLPGKPLRLLDGIPMIEHVHRQALASGAAEVIIATDAPAIAEVAEGFGATVCLTAVSHTSGTDRLAEVAERLGWADDDIVVNLQGDEPLMPPALVRAVAGSLAARPGAGIGTVCHRIRTVHEVFDPNVVKVVADTRGEALYFSRAPIPYYRDGFAGDSPQLPVQGAYFRHIGLYAYRVEVLRRFSRLPPCPVEQVESLEQLRALWNGIRIFVLETDEAPPHGVDTERDVERVEALLKARG